MNAERDRDDIETSAKEGCGDSEDLGEESSAAPRGLADQNTQHSGPVLRVNGLVLQIGDVLSLVRKDAEQERIVAFVVVLHEFTQLTVRIFLETPRYESPCNWVVEPTDVSGADVLALECPNDEARNHKLHIQPRNIKCRSV